jgi:hypothetical protein
MQLREEISLLLLVFLAQFGDLSFYQVDKSLESFIFGEFAWWRDWCIHMFRAGFALRRRG